MRSERERERTGKAVLRVRSGSGRCRSGPALQRRDCLPLAKKAPQCTLKRIRHNRAICATAPVAEGGRGATKARERCEQRTERGQKGLSRTEYAHRTARPAQRTNAALREGQGRRNGGFGKKGRDRERERERKSGGGARQVGSPSFLDVIGFPFPPLPSAMRLPLSMQFSAKDSYG